MTGHVYTEDGRRLYTLAQLPEVTGIPYDVLRKRRSRRTLPEPDAQPDRRTPFWTKESIVTVIASLNPSRSIATYDLLDELTETYGLSREDAHASIHTFLSQIVEIDGDGVILAQEPQRPELLKSNPRDVDIDAWITISAGAADGIREAFAATYSSE